MILGRPSTSAEIAFLARAGPAEPAPLEAMPSPPPRLSIAGNIRSMARRFSRMAKTS